MTSIYNICKIARGYWKHDPISTHCTAMLGGPMVPGRNQLIEFPIVEKSRILKTIQFQLRPRHLPLAGCAPPPRNWFHKREKFIQKPNLIRRSIHWERWGEKNSQGGKLRQKVVFATKSSPF